MLATSARPARPRPGQGCQHPQATKRSTAVGAGLLLLLVIAGAMVGRGLGDESVALVGGDEVRYVMNGVFVHDALRDGPFRSLSGVFGYATHYYAQYPALSLGFHPPLLAVVHAPLVAVLGPGMTAGRVVNAAFFLLGVAALWALVSRTAGRAAGWIAAAMFATNPWLVFLGRHVLSEISALALVIVAAWGLDRFCASERRRDLVGFVLAAAASAWAKQLALGLFPVYAAYAWLQLGVPRLRRADTVFATGLLIVLVAPVVPMTLSFGGHNVGWIWSLDLSWRRIAAIGAALSVQFPPVALLTAGIGLARAIGRRDAGLALFLLWLPAAMITLVVLTGDVEPERYGVYMMPAVIALAAAAGRGAGPALRVGVVALALAAVAVQGVAVVRRPLPRAPGYEDAARYVLAHGRGEPVLYSGALDSGLFVLFVRKHDPARRTIVLRADKLLATSELGMLHADRIRSRDEIDGIVRRFGVRYVVLEDRATSSTPLEWLRDETRTARYVERHRTPPALTAGQPPLAVFEYVHHGSPEPGAVVEMRLPLARTGIRVRLEDLLTGRYRQR